MAMAKVKISRPNGITDSYMADGISEIMRRIDEAPKKPGIEIEIWFIGLDDFYKNKFFVKYGWDYDKYKAINIFISGKGWTDYIDETIGRKLLEKRIYAIEKVLSHMNDIMAICAEGGINAAEIIKSYKAIN